MAKKKYVFAQLRKLKPEPKRAKKPTDWLIPIMENWIYSAMQIRERADSLESGMRSFLDLLRAPKTAKKRKRARK